MSPNAEKVRRYLRRWFSPCTCYLVEPHGLFLNEACPKHGYMASPNGSSESPDGV